MFSFKKNSWATERARYIKGNIDIQTFVDRMKDCPLYYSTPLGDDQEGKPHLYILSSHASEYGYYPAFLSQEHCMQFFTSVGRNGFMIIEGDLKSFLSSLDSSPPLAELGAVIEPNGPDEMTIPQGVRIK